MEHGVAYCLILCFAHKGVIAAEKQITVETAKDETFQFFPIEGTFIRFDVKAVADAHVALAAGPKNENPIVMVYICTSAKETEMRYGVPPQVKVKAPTPGYLSKDEFRSFWIWKNGNDISFGREGDKCPILFWSIEQSLVYDMPYFGIRTSQNTGSWRFKDDPDAQTPETSIIRDPYDQLPKKILTLNTGYGEALPSGSSEGYVWIHWNATAVNFKLKAEEEAEIVLSAQTQLYQPYSKITLGGSKASGDCANCKPITVNLLKAETMMIQPGMISNDRFISFWLRWGSGKVSMGYRGNVCPFLSWNEPRNFKVAALGFRTLKNLATWNIEVPVLPDGRIGYLDPAEDPKFKLPVNNTVPVVIDTEAGSGYKYFAVKDAKCLYFRVKTHSSAVVGVAEEQGRLLFSGLFGFNQSTKSFVAREDDNFRILETPTDKIVREFEMRRFWICWEDSSFTMGRGASVQCPILNWTDSEPLRVNYVGIRSGRDYGARFELNVPVPDKIIPPEDLSAVDQDTENEIIEPTTESVGINKTEKAKVIYTDPGDPFKYMKWDRNYIRLKVKTEKDAIISLSPTNDSLNHYEVCIGGWGNKKTSIHKNSKYPKAVTNTHNIVSRDMYREFWLRWEGGFISVGNKGESCPIVSWCDPSPLTVNYIGIRSGNNSKGAWSIKDGQENYAPGKVPILQTMFSRNMTVNDSQLYIEYTTATYLYKFFPWSTKEMRFKVKSLQDAHVALSTATSSESYKYEIYIGGWKNQKSAIEKLGHLPKQKVLVKTPGIMNEAEFREFWVHWDDGTIQVGQGGQNCPFMSWCDPEPLEVEYIGVRTLWRANAIWKLEGFEKKFTKKTLKAVREKDFKGPVVTIYQM